MRPMPGEPVTASTTLFAKVWPATGGCPLISFVEDESAFQVVVHRARDATAGVAALDDELRLASFHEFEPTKRSNFSRERTSPVKPSM